MMTHKKKTLMRQVGIFLCLAYVVSHGAVAQQTTPQLIPFQGRLTDQAGVAISDDSSRPTLIFNLYDVPVGGTAVWTERHENVGVTGGLVNVFLGSINELPEWNLDQDSIASNYTLFFSEPKYLGITIVGVAAEDIEMIPRQSILPAFHVNNADTLDGYDWSSLLVEDNGDPDNDIPTNDAEAGVINGSKIENAGITSDQIKDGDIYAVDLTLGSVSGGTDGTIQDGSITTADLSIELSGDVIPVGGILAYAGSVEPDGWMFCDGRLLDPTVYDALHSVIGDTWGTDDNDDYFKIPDMRGRVLAGKTDVDTADRLNPTLEDDSSLFVGFVDGLPSNNTSTLGAVGGEDMHQTTLLELPSHAHSLLGFFANRQQFDDGSSRHDTYSFSRPDEFTSSTGGDKPHNNVQPIAIVNYIICVGQTTNSN